MKQLSPQKVKNIVSLLKEGKSARQVAQLLRIGRSTVDRVATKHGIQKVKKLGRPKKLKPTNVTHCVTEIYRNRAKTATELSISLRSDQKIEVHRTTVARALKAAGLKSGEKKSKPLLSKKNIRDRLDFAKTHKDWTEEDWKRVIFSDETKINRFNADGKTWCWFRDGEELNPRNVKQTVKHGGGNIKLWGCMTAQGVGFMCQIEGIMDSKLYLDILNGELKKTIEFYELDEEKIIFQQDNDPKHTAKKVKEHLNNQKFNVLSWPAQSPDINPIEHLWAHMKRELNKYPSPANGLLSLWERVQEVWEDITPETCLNLISSMPRRMEAVIKAKGRWTKY
jgi:transposase